MDATSPTGTHCAICGRPSRRLGFRRYEYPENFAAELHSLGMPDADYAHQACMRSLRRIVRHRKRRDANRNGGKPWKA